MWRSDLHVYLTVISHRRAANVPAMTALIGPATWVVADGDDFDAYADSGAPEVIVAGRGLCVQRNAALDAAFAAGHPCVMLDDDLKRVAYLDRPTGTLTPITFAEAIGHLRAAREMLPEAALFGGPPTDNPLFAARSLALATTSFIIAQSLLIWPCEIRFDEALTLKEDYDYTLAHLARFGVVGRLNWLAWEFAHYGNGGGCQEYRDDAREEAAIAYLRAKWGDQLIRRHPRRPHEILLNWPTPLKRIAL